MKNVILATMIGFGAAGAAYAQGLAEMDSDGSGTLSMEELQAAHPTLTAEAFAAIDANGDGAVDEAELAAGVEAGLVPTEG